MEKVPLNNLTDDAATVHRHLMKAFQDLNYPVNNK